ncbi:MAG: sigma-70 family RNA polymerase sigma factor [Chloroflexi bacterium]|nr:sigma-70 family RNA polymerase sigma factor [Chloroflexota bacterium]
MNKNVENQEDAAHTEVTDLTLSIEALKAGDRAEFAKLVEAYSNHVYRLALKILNDPQDAEDVLQETFIKALRALPEFEERSKLSTWLYRIAVNEALMAVRRRKPDHLSLETEKEGEEGEMAPVEIVDWCCLPEGDLLSAEARRFLNKAVQALSPALRAVFVLRDVEGLSVKETAEALNISEAAVKTRLLRARLKLREELSIYFGERVSERKVSERSANE